MQIDVVLSTNKGLKKCIFPNEKMVLELITTLRTKEIEDVVLTDGEYQVDGVFIPSKGNKSTIIVLPMEDENEK